MNYALFILTIILFQGAGAQETCSKSKSAIADLETLCEELNKSNSIYCNIKAPSLRENLPPVSYGILSASGKMKSLFEKMSQIQAAFLQDHGGCPAGCSRVNAPVVEITTKPTAVIADAACPRTYTSLSLGGGELSRFGVEQGRGFFRKSFRMPGDLTICQEQATKFAQDTLMGNNDLGEYLEEQKCRSPCSYSSLIRLKTQSVPAGCEVVLELGVQCGPPKKDRQWETTASLTKTFHCEVGR